MQPSERKCTGCGCDTANHAYCDNCLKPNPQADGQTQSVNRLIPYVTLSGMSALVTNYMKGMLRD